MIPNKINLKEYERFFEVDDAGYLLTDIYKHAYQDMGFLSIKKANRVGIYLSKKGVIKSKKTGLDLYATGQYKQKFDSFEKFIAGFDGEMSQLKFNRTQDLNRFFNLIFSFFEFYKYLEYFYTDNVYTDHSTIADLDMQNDIARVKTKGRILLNKIFLEDNGYMNSLFTALTSKYGIPRNILFNLSHSEITALSSGFKPDTALINSRSANYLRLTDKDNDLFVNNPEDILLESDLNLSLVNRIKGTIACMGQYSGVARVIEPNYSNYGCLDQILSEMKSGEVLVVESTSPDIIRACKLAGAIIANQGGMGSHAAIISREMGIPCLVGTQNATQHISTGDLVYVNANNGYIEILERGKAVS